MFFLTARSPSLIFRSALLAYALTSSVAYAQYDSLVGKEVGLDGYRNEIPIMLDDKIAHRNDASRVYRVKAISGDRALIYCPGDGVEGYVAADRVVPMESALEYYTAKIAANPRSSHDYNSRGLIWSHRREYDKAIADYTEDLRLKPRTDTGYRNRAICWGRKKEFDIAIADASDAIRFGPHNRTHYLVRGEAWRREGNYDKAIADFDKAYDGDPESRDRSIQHSWIWSSCPDSKYRDGKRAVEAATKACEESKWQGYGQIDALAAAYAEVGDFDKAVETEKKAIELMKTRDHPRTENFEKRLALYQDQKPFRFVPENDELDED